MQKDLGRAITFPRSFCGEFAAVQAAVNSRHLPLENLHSFASRRIQALWLKPWRICGFTSHGEFVTLVAGEFARFASRRIWRSSHPPRNWTLNHQRNLDLCHHGISLFVIPVCLRAGIHCFDFKCEKTQNQNLWLPAQVHTGMTRRNRPRLTAREPTSYDLRESAGSYIRPIPGRQ